MSNAVLVVEDELVTGQTIVELLTDEDYTVMGPAKNAAEAIALCEKGEGWPEVALCDVNLKGKTKGTELAHSLKQRYACEVVFISAYTDRQTLNAAFESEPTMYIVKPFTDTQLLVAVQMALYRKFRKNETGASHTLDLTAREQEIAELVAGGFTSKQIASKLTLSAETVKTHRRRMLQKNNLNSFPQLIYLMNKQV
jgi:DNA-binding NarL/FixJ family response regulator